MIDRPDTTGELGPPVGSRGWQRLCPRTVITSWGIALALTVSGCSSGVDSFLASRLVGADGQLFVVEDLESIARDPALDVAGKREAFRSLGIEDEELIDILLRL